MKHCCNIMTVKVDEGQVVFIEGCYWMIPAHGIRKNPMPTTWRYCPYCGKSTVQWGGEERKVKGKPPTSPGLGTGLEGGIRLVRKKANLQGKLSTSNAPRDATDRTPSELTLPFCRGKIKE